MPDPRIAKRAWEAQVEKFLMGPRARRTWTSEDITDFAGMPPDHPNSVGAMINALYHEGRIVRVGYALARNSRSHGALLRTWKVPFRKRSRRVSIDQMDLFPKETTE